MQPSLSETMRTPGTATGEEQAVLREAVAWMDCSARGRLCVLGADRASFLHGQLTNDIRSLKPGEGCRAFLVSGKGKIQADIFVYSMGEEFLLDFEEGHSAFVKERLEKFLAASDAQIVDAAPHFGMLTIQGPKAEAALENLRLGLALPKEKTRLTWAENAKYGQLYLARCERFLSAGYDLFAPTQTIGELARELDEAVRSLGGRAVGSAAAEQERIERGIPKFGVDFDENNLPQETGLESVTVSFNKGCYIGQEVINRIRTIGHVNKKLRGLIFEDGLTETPLKGSSLLREGKPVGQITSAVKSAKTGRIVALGYVRKEVDEAGAELCLEIGEVRAVAKVAEIPFA